ncbi:CoB--CoM heterodisulfide reductase iron-sulfur subunit B family protein [Desulfopila aestuarii]|uniref:Heterodisulfide reductase subunit B n=1 Tax=Desulfopila aestuarii DSM 18488 TaxID=1121416 RepID=A0A1M7Y3A5_9BACT|nr:heterodisulfide reductase-related iron-sulfur binding cluster [Desulfopila aestuarii]SHO46647.1 heterodisulfide reductase subunit B [Desulfopila aestuarii DSM 18488]
MKMAYYPGCSLQGTARDYNESILDICNTLDIELVEIPDWNCCGASSAHMTNHEVAMRLSIRNLMQVKDEKLDILVPCPACFQRLKAADKALKHDPYHWDVDDYSPKFELVHISTFLAKPEILERISAKISRPVGDMRVACYYGCLSLRPQHLTDAVNHEMPTTLETIVSAVGARPVSWSHRTECCSGSLTMTRPDIAGKLVGDIVRAAERGGANAMVTDCPMCQANVEGRQLDINPSGPHIPVYYATELITAAMSGSYPEKQQKVHLVSAQVLQNHLNQAALSSTEETR